MRRTLALKTLRTPISFLLCSALNAARPNNPRHEMPIPAFALSHQSFSDTNFFRSFFRSRCTQVHKIDTGEQQYEHTDDTYKPHHVHRFIIDHGFAINGM